MTHYLEIFGGRSLNGTVRAGGAKNAALPQLIASLLTGERCRFKRVPNLADVSLTLHLLETFGAETTFSNDVVEVTAKNLIATEASLSLVKSLRASFWVMGPLLARGGAARVALPGGDIIGARPVDMHIEALTKMGAEIKVKHGVVFASAPQGLRPARIEFRFPSVGATHQVLMAAALTPGTTEIIGAAREPEVVALADMLNAMGAQIEGAGSNKIVISGAESLKGCDVDLIGDRIEAGTYLLAGAATGGKVTVEGVAPHYFGAFLDVLEQMGLEVTTSPTSVGITARGRLQPVHVATGPYPQLATDLQAPLMAALTLAEGDSSIEEHIFEGRFGNVSELCRMGAQIRVEERKAIIHGVAGLSGADVDGMDIRAAASLVVAGLAAEGTTRLHEIQHLRRGYELVELKFGGIGGIIKARMLDPDDYCFTGC